MKTLKHNSCTYVKHGVYYFSRSVPVDLRLFYSRDRINQSLRTISQVQASVASKALSAKLDYWLGFRIKHLDIPAAHLLVSKPGIPESDPPNIHEALQTYLSLKEVHKCKIFVNTAQRSISYLKDALGEKALDQYATSDAAKYRDWLINKGLGSSL